MPILYVTEISVYLVCWIDRFSIFLSSLLFLLHDNQNRTLADDNRCKLFRSKPETYAYLSNLSDVRSYDRLHRDFLLSVVCVLLRNDNYSRRSYYLSRDSYVWNWNHHTALIFQVYNDMKCICPWEQYHLHLLIYLHGMSDSQLLEPDDFHGQNSNNSLDSVLEVRDMMDSRISNYFPEHPWSGRWNMWMLLQQYDPFLFAPCSDGIVRMTDLKPIDVLSCLWRA